MKQLASQNVSEEQKRSELEKLAQEEHESMLALQKTRAMEEKAANEAIRLQQEAILAQAVAEAHQAEIEAAAMITKEASLNAIREMKARAAEDLLNTELQQIKDSHARQEERLQKEADAMKKANKGKLEERLQAKKLKKMKELEEQESRQLKELALKQEKDREERERLKKSKAIWKEVLQEAMDRSNEMGLSGLEREDFCFQETLAKNLVPEAQINEVVQRVLNARHSAEMAALLSTHFEERIGALKSAVEKVMEEKSQARAEITAQLQSRQIDEETARQEFTNLDVDFSVKQAVAEKKATGTLEQLHLKQQLNLRQQQFDEMTKIVSMYIDPETMARLAESSGVNKLQEMAEYRERLAAEKRAREEAAAKERSEAEAKLRAQYDADLAKMEEQLAKDRRLAIEDFERKQKEVLRQREEMERKQAVDKEELDKIEKARILANFEKEEKAALEAQENERKAQKSKLQNRLNLRKNKAAAAAVSAAEASPEPAHRKSSAEMLSSAAGGGAPSPAFAATSKPDNASKLNAAAKLHKVVAKVGSQDKPPVSDASPALAQSISLIQSKLERIERVMMALEKGEIVSNRPEAEPAQRVAYHDSDEPIPGDSLDVVPDDSVHVQEKARLAFGQRLAQMVGLRNVKIRTAASLPPSSAVNNSFANSYSYNPQSETLFVHRNRLSSSGDFGLVMIHALSHIKVCISSLIQISM